MGDSVSKAYYIDEYRYRGGRDFPGIYTVVEGTSARDALVSNFPAFDFIRNPPLMFPAECRITVSGPWERGCRRSSHWGYVRKAVGEAVR